MRPGRANARCLVLVHAERHRDRVPGNISFLTCRSSNTDGLLLDALLEGVCRRRLHVTQLNACTRDRRLPVLDRDLDRTIEARICTARIARQVHRALRHRGTNFLRDVRGQLRRDLTTLRWMGRTWNNVRRPLAGPMIANPRTSDHVVGNLAPRAHSRRCDIAARHRRRARGRAAARSLARLCLGESRNRIVASRREVQRDDGREHDGGSERQASRLHADPSSTTRRVARHPACA
jgi:hypothetical protein